MIWKLSLFLIFINIILIHKVLKKQEGLKGHAADIVKRLNRDEFPDINFGSLMANLGTENIKALVNAVISYFDAMKVKNMNKELS